MKKKVVGAVLAAVLATQVSACGSTTSASSSSPAETGASDAQATEENTSAASQKSVDASGEESPTSAIETTTNDDGIIVPKFDDHVTLDVVAFVDDNEADGERSDPISKYIEENLNITLNLTHVTEADWPTQLSAMMADGDLPDIFLLSDATKQLPMLIKSNSALAINNYIDYAPNTTADPRGQMMITANEMKANSPDGNLYLWGLCKGSWDDGTIPTCGHYIRWDLYSQLGYPELNSYDDLLDVLEKMVKTEPQTTDGQKTYGLGAWYGAGQDWGEWVFTYGMAPQEGAALVLTSGRTLAVSTVDSKPINVNQLTDPDSYLWRAVEFYNKANQRGLLDPDSFTMSSDVYEENLKAGKYMFNVPGWMSTSANNEFNKEEGNKKMFISLPSINSDAEDRFGNMYHGEREYVINAQTEYPERCVALLDFVSTYAFSRIAYNGLEGDQWKMENGVPVPTDEYLAADKSQDDFINATGAGVYHHFLGYGNGTIDPATGTAVDLYQFSEKALNNKMTDTMKDFLKHYGQDSQIDVYRAETPTTDSQNYISFADPDEEIASYVNQINAYMGTNVFNCVAAKSDEEFAAARDAMIKDLQDKYHVDDVFNYFYQNALSQADDVATLVDMSKNIK